MFEKVFCDRPDRQSTEEPSLTTEKENDKLEVVKKDLNEKNIRMSVIQSKIINKTNQLDDTQIKMDKLKRANLICEDCIKSLHQKVTEIPEKYGSVNIEYEKLRVANEVLKQEIENHKAEKKEFSEKMTHTVANYDGIDQKYQNLIEQHQTLKSDHEKTC